jgi:hypothetical protein
MRQGIVGGTGLSAPPGRLQQNWVFNGLGEGDSLRRRDARRGC